MESKLSEKKSVNSDCKESVFNIQSITVPNIDIYVPNKVNMTEFCKEIVVIQSYYLERLFSLQARITDSYFASSSKLHIDHVEVEEEEDDEDE